VADDNETAAKRLTNSTSVTTKQRPLNKQHSIHTWPEAPQFVFSSCIKNLQDNWHRFLQAIHSLVI